MATRIAHISDLHFPATRPDQPPALAASIIALRPDLMVVSGDLTRSGTRAEFEMAAQFLHQLGVRMIVVPGNHDVPVSAIGERILAPFRRFRRYFETVSEDIETPDALIVGLNSAVGLQWRLDWSLGKIVRSRLERCIQTLEQKRGNRLGIVVCHHPLNPHAADSQRSKTDGGPEAYNALVEAGMGILLHGHLHRPSITCVDGKHRSCEICASTGLSDRERGNPAGYNIIDIEDGEWHLSVVIYKNGSYVLST